MEEWVLQRVNGTVYLTRNDANDLENAFNFGSVDDITARAMAANKMNIRHDRLHDGSDYLVNLLENGEVNEIEVTFIDDLD